ncbi:MAG: EAL and HDOD domain-containing protein [Desulfosoma sp.]|uniref:EAL and HDOD domain-containing protein n=1 Tax=Desulfosoma sp. TaxID=2603217 RepID=UPI00404ABD6C
MSDTITKPSAPEPPNVPGLKNPNAYLHLACPVESFIARQPIFDRRLQVYGYEILYRAACQDQEAVFQDGDQASVSVIQNLFFTMGTELFAGGRKAFVNFTQNLLLQDAPYLLPKEWAVIEILENVQPIPAVHEACRRLKERGYLLALDDVILLEDSHRTLLNLVDIVKVDFRGTSVDVQERIARDLGSRIPHLLAEKTETREEFQKGLQAGYTLFQGYFFSRPVIIERKDVPVFKFHALQLIANLNRPDLDVESLHNVIKRDPALIYKLLRYINSAFFGLRHRVTSIRHALALLGEREIRKWATLSVFSRLTAKQPNELMKLSLIRARFLELLADLVNMGSQKEQLFLMGIFSVMDTLLGRPIDEALEEVPLDESIKAALLGTMNRHRVLYEIVLGYERAKWDTLSHIGSNLHIEASALTARYLQAVEWTEHVFRVQ